MQTQEAGILSTTREEGEWSVAALRKWIDDAERLVQEMAYQTNEPEVAWIRGLLMEELAKKRRLLARLMN